MTLISAGHVIVRTLETHGVRDVFEVPGESFLDVLDGLHDSSIRTVVCRQEGGAAFAAEAQAKITGRPGVAMVTRGPGAANAMIAIHQAYQDGTPLILFVGLVPLADRQRESFQEFDIRGWFGTTTKQVLVLDEPDRAGEMVAQAMHAAMSGRPGPVVIGLPEDVLRAPCARPVIAPIPVTPGAVGQNDLELVRSALAASSTPLVVTGGNEWTPEAAAQITRWLEQTGIPAASQWRGAGVVPSSSRCYVGTLGYGREDAVASALADADLVITIGCVLGDVDTDGYTLRQRPDARTIVATNDPARLGHSGPVTGHLLARPAVVAAALAGLEVVGSPQQRVGWNGWRAGMRAAFETSSALPAVTPAAGAARMDTVFAHLVPELPADAMVTFGAGNHTIWAQRYFPTLQYPALISSRNGSMGYSVPSAVAAALTCPERLVVAVAGDGEFMMNANELATATQLGVAPLLIVMDNGQFGTIRTHQNATYPGRVSGTHLVNPDFAAMGAAMGAVGIRVEKDEEVPAAVAKALDAVRIDRRPALLHVVVDPDVLLP